jgi:hypothetical protein
VSDAVISINCNYRGGLINGMSYLCNDIFSCGYLQIYAENLETLALIGILISGSTWYRRHSFPSDQNR